MWLRNEIISKMKCNNCGYGEQVNQFLRQYPESQLPCPKCENEQRDFEVIKKLTLQDTSAQTLLADLRLTQNEILHCETSKGKIAIQFY